MDTNHTPQALSEAVATEGFEPHESAVSEFVADSRRLGLSGTLADIVGDSRQPVVARERAFGRLVAAYCNIGHQVEVSPHPGRDRFTVAA